MPNIVRIYGGASSTQFLTDWISKPLFYYFEVTGPTLEPNESYLISYASEIEIPDPFFGSTRRETNPDLLSIDTSYILVPPSQVYESGYRTRLILFATQPFSINIYAVVEDCTQEDLCRRIEDVQTTQNLQLGLDLLTGVADLITTGVLVGGALALTSGALAPTLISSGAALIGSQAPSALALLETATTTTLLN